ncbi:MAG: hypothetical protein K0Q52_205 [Microbacterium sp.]|jgi:hypothetical protein|nr:hypothetical protein [Microbacterium sp.]
MTEATIEEAEAALAAPQGPFIRITVEIQEPLAPDAGPKEPVDAPRYTHAEFLPAGFPVVGSLDPAVNVHAASVMVAAVAARLFVQHFAEDLA